MKVSTRRCIMNYSFSTPSDFETFVKGLKAEEIQKMTSQDWVKLFDKISQNPEINVPSAKQAFIKLYTNYRPEKEQVEKIKALARKSAKSLIAEHPELKKEISEFNLLNIEKKQKILETIRDNIHINIFGHTKKVPRIEMQNEFWENTKRRLLKQKGVLEGSYRDENVVNIRLKSRRNMITVAAHEFWHSAQGINSVDRLSSFFVMPKNFDSTKKLNLFNSRFYMKGMNSYKAYRSQPLEYSAKLFEVYFAKEMFDQIGVKNFVRGTEEYQSKPMNLAQSCIYRLKNRLKPKNIIQRLKYGGAKGVANFCKPAAYMAKSFLYAIKNGGFEVQERPEIKDFGKTLLKQFKLNFGGAYKIIEKKLDRLS